MKKILSIFMSLAVLSGCGGNDSTQGSETLDQNENSTENGIEDISYDYSDVKIGILGHFESGETLDAMTVYMDALSEEIGFSYEYVVGSSYDEQTNITASQNLIASGVDGIIMTLDSGTESIIAEAESAGVFVAGFITDMDSSFDDIQSSDNFLGLVNDGLYDNSSIGEKAAELVIENGNKNVGVVSFPLLYFPQKQGAIDAFHNSIESYNSTADETIEVYETQELSFTQLEETYFNNHPELDSILSLAAGFVHPTMVSADKLDVDLYTTGFKKDDVSAFEKEEIRMMTLSNIEAISYPLAMILNEIAESPYTDLPEETERVDTSILFVTNQEELTALEEKTLYFTADMDQSFISADEFKEYLTVYNSEASYEELKNDLMNMSMEDLIAK